MKGFSRCRNTLESVFPIFKDGFSLTVLLIVFLYNVLLGLYIIFSGYLGMQNPVYGKKTLLLFYLFIAILSFVWNISKRLVTVYLSSDVDTITKSQFMDKVNTGKVLYIADTHDVGFMRTKLLFLNKEEYLVVRRRIARFESGKVKRGIQRVRLCGFNW